MLLQTEVDSWRMYDTSYRMAKMVDENVETYLLYISVRVTARKAFIISIIKPFRKRRS